MNLTPYNILLHIAESKGLLTPQELSDLLDAYNTGVHQKNILAQQALDTFINLGQVTGQDLLPASHPPKKSEGLPEPSTKLIRNLIMRAFGDVLTPQSLLHFFTLNGLAKEIDNGQLTLSNLDAGVKCLKNLPTFSEH